MNTKMLMKNLLIFAITLFVTPITTMAGEGTYLSVQSKNKDFIPVPINGIHEEEEIIAKLENSCSIDTINCAYTLITGLKFHQTQYIPGGKDAGIIYDIFAALKVIRKHFDAGTLILPILYNEAIMSQYKWYRDRIAVAIKLILNVEYINKYNKIYSFDNTTNTYAKDFFLSTTNFKNMNLNLSKKITIDEYGRYCLVFDDKGVGTENCFTIQ